MDTFDGWAIATSPDGIAAYGGLPAGARIMCWIKPNAIPGSHRLRSSWEPVLLYPPQGRRSNRTPRGMMSDVHTAPYPRGFIGQKPESWTHWILDAFLYDPDQDHVVDMFEGSGAVGRAVALWRPSVL